MADDAEPDDVEAWLETATGRLITDRWRAERGAQRWPRVHPDGDPYDVVADFVELARSRSALDAGRGDAGINQVFGLLPPADADLLQRRLVDDVEPAELWDDLGISRAAVDQRVSRAKARLKAALAAQPELLAELQAGHPHVYDRGRQ